MNDRLHGVIVPVLTPLLHDCTVDVEAAMRHMKWLCRKGVHGLFILGTNGEGYDLDDRNRQDMISAAKEIAGSIPVYAGCMGMGTADMKRRMEAADKSQPDALVVMLPTYATLSEPQEQHEYFLGLKRHTETRLIIYNLPSATKSSIYKSVILELATEEQFIGVKDSSGNAKFFSSLIDENPRPGLFRILMGYPWLCSWALMRGGDGIVPSTANIDPEGSFGLYQTACSGQYDKVAQYQMRMDSIRALTERYGRSLSMKQILYWDEQYSAAASAAGDTISPSRQDELRKEWERIQSCED